MNLAERFIKEDLALHWQVDATKESFKRLMRFLELGTNFIPYFQEALRAICSNSEDVRNDLVIADVGAGVCWTSAILANLGYVRHVYAVEPSNNRLKHAEFVIDHFNVPREKITIVKGSFSNLRISQQVDIVVLCGSFHHCYEQDIPVLFDNIRKLLKPMGKVLIANEHYVDFIWVLRRVAIYFKNFRKRDKNSYALTALRSPHPYDGEHWRTKIELENIFQREGFKATFFNYEGDLCKDKPTFLHRVGWHYYYAVLERNL